MKHPEPSLLWLSSLARPIDSLLVREMTWFDRTSLYTPHGVFTDSQLFLRSTFLRPTTAIVVRKTSWLPVYKFLEENSSFRSISTLYIYIYISFAKHVKRDTRLIKCVSFSSYDHFLISEQAQARYLLLVTGFGTDRPR